MLRSRPLLSSTVEPEPVEPEPAEPKLFPGPEPYLLTISGPWLRSRKFVISGIFYIIFITFKNY